MGPDLDIPLEPQRLCEHCGFRDKEASPDEDSVWLCDDCRDEDTYYNATQEARELIDRLEKENSDLLRKSKRAVELLRLAKKEIIEMSNAIWDEYEGVDEMERIDNELARELEAFLHELEGK